MLKKIRLFYQIRKFYKTYGDLVGSNFITKLSDITENNLFDVQFDIKEVLKANSYCFYEEAYEEDARLNELLDNINSFNDKSKNHITYTFE